MGFTSTYPTNASPLDGLCAVLSGMIATAWPMLLQVMLFQPIALDEQAKDLLRAGQYEQALHLAGICAADGALWAETAFAETALLLLHGRLSLDPRREQGKSILNTLFFECVELYLSINQRSKFRVNLVKTFFLVSCFL